MTKVSCIICVFNEEKQVGAVLRALRGHPLVDEVIVVDDGSTDHTVEIVEQHQRDGHETLHLVAHERNRGKSAAFATGVTRARNDLLLFLDGDLVGLTADDVTALITPVADGQADMSLSLKQNSLETYKFLGLDFVSGERVYAKHVIEGHLDAIARLPSFAVETYVNRLVIERASRIASVWWPRVTHLRKSHKYGTLRGTWGEFRMIIQICRLESPFRLLALYRRMLRLTTRVG